MHSPGPWKRRSIPGHLFELSDPQGPILAIRGGMMPTLDDARMIEAAPTMYDALMVIVTDPKISAWLAQNDPKALEQVISAVPHFPGVHVNVRPDDSEGA